MGEGVVKSPEKLPTSFMDGPLVKVHAFQPSFKFLAAGRKPEVD